MSETAGELVKQMVEAGEWPPPKLLDEIVARGQEAVEPLLEVVRSEPHGWPAEAPLDHALVILGALRPPEAVEPLLGLFRKYHNETLETAVDVLAGYGPPLVEPALAIVRDASVREYGRELAVDLAIKAAGADPERRSGIAAVLRELLAEHLARAPEKPAEEQAEADEEVDEAEDDEYEEDEYEEDEYRDDEYDEFEDDDYEDEGAEEESEPDPVEEFYRMATTLVVDLARLADPEARDLIRDAYEADLVDRGMIREEDVERTYRDGGEQPEPVDPRGQLEDYRKHYQLHQEDERRKAAGVSQPLPRVRPPVRDEAGYFPDSVPQPFLNVDRKPGRNDPCWCGSGKKYKKCHLIQDQK